MCKSVQNTKEVLGGLDFLPWADLLVPCKQEGKTKTEM